MEISKELFELESKIYVGSKIYIVKCHFTEKRELKELVNKVIINEAERKTA